MKTKINYLIIGFFIVALLSCKKKKEDENSASASCTYLSGSFEINFNGNTYTFVRDEESHFTILYNWDGDEETHFVLIGKDQNGQALGFEMAAPGIMTKGSHSYSEAIYDYFGLDLEINDVSYYTTTVNFEILESNLDTQDGSYKPIRGTFNGTAKKWTTMGEEPSTETFSYSGSFCLNGIII